jgi:hypothetical protein
VAGENSSTDGWPLIKGRKGLLPGVSNLQLSKAIIYYIIGCRDSASRDVFANHKSIGMTDGDRSFKEKLALHIVRFKITQIFEECSKFEERDKNALYEEIGNLLLQRIRSAETPSPADEAPPEFIGLTDATITDDLNSSSNHCTNASSRMSRLPRVDVSAAFPE